MGNELPNEHPDEQDKRNEAEIERLRLAQASEALKAEAARLVAQGREREKAERKAERKKGKGKKGR